MITGERDWNSERGAESVNAGAERQIQSGVWNRETYLRETEGDTDFKRS